MDINNYNFSDSESVRELINRATAYKAAVEGITLLENKEILPMDTKTVALYGVGAKHTIANGLGSGEVDSRFDINIYDGLKMNNINIVNEVYLNDLDNHYENTILEYKKEIKEKLKHLKIKDLTNSIFMMPHLDDIEITDKHINNYQSDIAIYVISRKMSENNDVLPKEGEYYLSNAEIKNIKLLSNAYKNIIIIINSGHPIDLRELDNIENKKAVIYMGYAGMMGGKALADLLVGKQNFSAKLTTTWPKYLEDIPGNIKTNADSLEQDYTEDIFVGYRFFDSFNIKPRYRFGHGLSYTDFLTKVNEINIDTTKVTISFQVENIGNYPGKEVVPLYIECPNGTLYKEKNKLIGFVKTSLLKPNESESCQISFDLNDIVSFNENSHIHILDKGIYTLKLGNKLVPVANLSLSEKISTSLHKPIFDNKKEINVLTKPTFIKRVDNVPTYEINPNSFELKMFKYYSYDNFNNTPSTYELLKTVIGKGLTNLEYPGAVGIISKNNKRNIDEILLSDGPAGLRLIKETKVKNNNKTKIITSPIESINYLPDAIKRIILASPNSKRKCYQYATKYPSEINLASTWNKELLSKVGYGMATEMQEFGIDFLLAPALNIIKNPLCGREFEYFSEDPYLSGICGASIINGISKIPNKYATIKHFCCNNQETNRNYYSANVSERALREIYLKSFEIAIKNSKPKAVMSSYNKVNGIYVANCYNLLTNVLRYEWDFDGIVMTDWYSTGKDKANPASAIKAGNDLLMPGSTRDTLSIIKYLLTKELSKEELICCYNRIINLTSHKKILKK